MAKKKTIELRSSGADVPSGDVNITYNGVRIAGFSEDTDATLKTGMKRVEHDIGIEYMKPAGGANYIPFTLTDTAETSHLFGYGDESNAILIKNVSELIAYTDPQHAEGIIPHISPIDPSVLIYGITVRCDTDALDVKLNNVAVAYDDRSAAYVVHDNDISEFNLTISDKNV